MLIYPTLLAGGLGTRLWPASRKSYPKQFSNFIGDESLFQQSARRLTSSDILEFAPHITLTNADFRFIIAEQLQAVGIDPGPILIEPEVKILLLQFLQPAFLYTPKIQMQFYL